MSMKCQLKGSKLQLSTNLTLPWPFQYKFTIAQQALNSQRSKAHRLEPSSTCFWLCFKSALHQGKEQPSPVRCIGHWQKHLNTNVTQTSPDKLHLTNFLQLAAISCHARLSPLQQWTPGLDQKFRLISLDSKGSKRHCKGHWKAEFFSCFGFIWFITHNEIMDNLILLDKIQVALGSRQHHNQQHGAHCSTYYILTTEVSVRIYLLNFVQGFVDHQSS